MNEPAKPMDLVLGTVQFGLRYGVAGRGEAVPEDEVRSMLACAYEAGIRQLDTAAAYGDIEERLIRLSGSCRFRVLTKLAPMPGQGSADEARRWAVAALERSERHLGEALDAVMFHRAEDLLGPHGEALWATCFEWTERQGVRLGVSCYDPATLLAIRERVPVAVTQLPGNALDQRLAAVPQAALDGIEVHVRSAFLQGLLLMPQDVATQRVPAAAHALTRWHGWLQERSLQALPAALGMIKGMPGAGACVVGADRLEQLQEIVQAWLEAPRLRAPELACATLSVIDPREWISTP